MIPSYIEGQVHFVSRNWKTIVSHIEQYWDWGYCVTNIEYGDIEGDDFGYVLVMSKISSWGKQAILYNSLEKVHSWGDDGYRITCVTWDGTDWIFVVTKSEELYQSGSNYFTRKEDDIRDFLATIQDNYKKGFNATLLSKRLVDGHEKYCAVCHEFVAFTHYYKFFDYNSSLFKGICSDMRQHELTLQDVCYMHGRVLVTANDLTDVKHQIFALGRLRYVLNAVDEDKYYITTIRYINGSWFAAASRYDLTDEEIAEREECDPF